MLKYDLMTEIIKKNDLICLRGIRDDKYTGEYIIIKIIWIDKNFIGIKEGYCMFGFKKIYTGWMDLKEDLI